MQYLRFVMCFYSWFVATTRLLDTLSFSVVSDYLTVCLLPIACADPGLVYRARTFK